MGTFDFSQVPMIAVIYGKLLNIKSVIDTYQSHLDFLASRLELAS